jgi:hypothetical protein
MNHDLRFFAVLTFVLARCTQAAGESDGVQETAGGVASLFAAWLNGW